MASLLFGIKDSSLSWKISSLFWCHTLYLIWNWDFNFQHQRILSQLLTSIYNIKDELLNWPTDQKWLLWSTKALLDGIKAEIGKFGVNKKQSSLVSKFFRYLLFRNTEINLAWNEPGLHYLDTTFVVKMQIECLWKK